MKYSELDKTKPFRRLGWHSTYPSWEHRQGLNYPLGETQHVYMGLTDSWSEDWINIEEGEVTYESK